MDGLARVAGEIVQRVTVGGKEYTLSTPTLRTWAALERELIAETNDILEKAAAAAAKIPPDQRAIYWEAAHREASKRCAVTMQDLDRMLPLDQAAASWFLALHEHHREEFSRLDDVRQWLLTHFGDQPLTAMRHVVENVVEGGLKNSASPTEEGRSSNV